MKHDFLRYTLALAVASTTTGVLFAQSTAPQRTDTDKNKTVTVTGCLKQEKDIAGMQPNTAERMGMGEDFVLTNAKLSTGTTSGSATSTPGSATSTPGSTPGASTAMGTSAVMYKIKGLDDDKLRAHVNQQVEIRGEIDNNGMTPGRSTTGTATGTGTTPTTEAGRAQAAKSGDADDLKELDATSIKMIGATCSSTSR